MKTLLFLLSASGLALSTAHAQNSFSFQGTFLTDDQLQLFSFTLASPETVMFQTFGYGGGTNFAKADIPPDGFESVLTLFGSDGSDLGADFSACGPVTLIRAPVSTLSAKSRLPRARTRSC